MADQCILDVAGAVERMGDREIYMEIAQYFSSRVEADLAALQSALHEGRMEEATRLAHSFKGSSATVGAEQARAACLALETSCRSGNAEASIALLQKVEAELGQAKIAIDALLAG